MMSNSDARKRLAELSAVAADEGAEIRRAAMQDARRAAIKAVMETGVSRGAAITEMPTCHKAKCFCDPDRALDSLVSLVLTRASDEVRRALILECDEEFARLDHQRAAWDEGYMHVMTHGTGRNTRGMNPYIAEPGSPDA